MKSRTGTNVVESLLLRLGHRPSRPVTIQSAADKRGHVKTNLRARAYRPISFGSFISDLVRLQQTNKSRITRCLRSAYAAAPIKSGTRISRVAFTCQRHHQASPNGQDAIGGIATSSRSLRGSACTRCTDGGPQKISCACLKGSNKETAIPINRDTNAPTRTATSGPRLLSPRPALPRGQRRAGHASSLPGRDDSQRTLDINEVVFTREPRTKWLQQYNGQG